MGKQKIAAAYVSGESDLKIVEEPGTVFVDKTSVDSTKIVPVKKGRVEHCVLGCWVQFDQSALNSGHVDVDQLYRLIAMLPGVWRVTPGKPDNGAIGPRVKTVGELRHALSELPDGTPLRIETYSEEEDVSIEGPITSMGVFVNEPKGTDCHDERLVVGPTFIMRSSHYTGVKDAGEPLKRDE